jgi:hypothetical protein
MAVTAKWYGKALLGQFSGFDYRRVDWASDTIKVALVKSTYAPDQDAHDFWDDVSANEVEGAGYTAGGKVLAEAVSAYDSGTNTVSLDAADLEWKEVTVTARYAVIYKDTEVPGESPLLGYVDFGEDVAAASGTIKIEWDGAGILRVVVE